MNYNIGDKIIDEKRDLTIIDKKIVGEKYHTKTMYKYLCNKCNYDCGIGYKNGIFIEDFWVSSNQITKGNNCACCSSKIISPYVNSISKLRPELIKYFTNKEDADRYSLSSNKKISFTCPECNDFSKTMVICDFIHNGFTCPKCSDKISIGEKIMFLLLSVLGVDFIKEYSFKDSVSRYDFYIPTLSTIIEVHGKQHYEGSFKTYDGGRNLSEEQENDKAKYDFALQNGIEKYIVIDARKSDFDYIQQSIIIELSSVFDLSNIDWFQLKQDVFDKNIVKDISIYWESNPTITFDEMEKRFHFSKDTIRKYLSIGESLGWCSSSTSINNSHYYNPYEYDAPNNTIPIKCIDNDTYFKGSCLCSKVSEEVFGFKIGDSTLRHILKGLKSKSRKVKYSFEYVTKEEFNNAINNGLKCYGSPYYI